MRRPLLAAALGVLFALPASAQTKIAFWHSQTEEALNTLVQRFNASQKDAVVEAQFVGNYNDATTKLQAALVANRQPVVMQFEITRYGLFAERGVLTPLDTLISADVKADILPGIWAASQYKGKSYVLPFNSSDPVMYVNKDLMRKAGLDPEKMPKTWDELLAAAQKLTKVEGGKTVQWGILSPPQWVRWAMTNQAGGGWVDPATHDVLLDKPESIEAYRFIADWILRYKVAPVDAAIKEEIAKQTFTSGMAAITFDSSGSLGGYKKDSKFDLGVAPLPCRKVCAAPIGGGVLGILAKSSDAEKKAAAAFISFMTQPENNAYWFVETGYLPIRKAPQSVATLKDFLAKNPEWAVAINQLDVAFGRARPPAMPAIRQKEEAVTQSIVLGKETAEQALKNFAEEMRRLIAADAG